MALSWTAIKNKINTYIGNDLVLRGFRHNEIMTDIMNYILEGTGFSDFTYSEVLAAKNVSGLVRGRKYKIVDRNIFIKALTNNKIDLKAERIMLVPKTYEITNDDDGNVWKGIYNSAGTYAKDDLVIWGGHVWINTTDVAGTPDDEFTLDSTNWSLIPKDSFSKNEYIEMVFSIEYDFENDWISKQMDKKGNVMGISYDGWINYIGVGINPVDATDWNMSTFFFNNKCIGVYNNSCSGYILDNSIDGIIYNNINNGSIRNNTNMGFIYENSNHGDIISNSNKGSIMYNSNAGSIDYNSNKGHIVANENSSHISENINNGSIESNSNSGRISRNINNGAITNNSSAGNVSDTTLDK